MSFAEQEDFISFDDNNDSFPVQDSVASTSKVPSPLITDDLSITPTNTSNHPWTQDMPFITRPQRPAHCLLHDEIVRFAEYMGPTAQEHHLRGLVIEQIRRALVKVWPDSLVQSFGSYATALYLPMGDIDLVISSPSLENQTKRTVLYAIAAILKRTQLATNIQVLVWAKVPIVKFVSIHGRFNMDISINQNNGLATQSLIVGYLDEHKALRPLLFILKAFLSHRALNEVYTGGLSSYSLVCMVVHFLRTHPKVRRREIDPMDDNLGILFLEFLELFGKHFNYDEVGISLKSEELFEKSFIGWNNHSLPYALSIMDPQDPSNDISKGSRDIGRIKRAFSGAYDSLASRIFDCHSSLAAISQQAYESLRATGAGMNLMDGPEVTQPNDRSFLSCLITIPKPNLKHRRNIEKLYRSGALQTDLGLDQNLPTPEISIQQDQFAQVIQAGHVSQIGAVLEPQDNARSLAQQSKSATSSKKKKKKKGRSSLNAAVVKTNGADNSASSLLGLEGEKEVPGLIKDRPIIDLLSEEESKYDRKSTLANPSPSKLITLSSDSDLSDREVQKVAHTSSFRETRREFWAAKAGKSGQSSES